MAQAFYLDNRDGFGERDYTLFLDTIGKFSHEKNKPAIITVSVVPVGNLTNWVKPERGAFVRLEDDRWLSRFPGVRDGVVFSGYVTEDPSPILLGIGPDGQKLYGFSLSCTSEDYIANLRTLPGNTYINKTRGEIIADLLRTMYKGSDNVPFNLDNVRNGGVERLYQVDVSKKFTDIVSEFAQADAFTYFVVDGHFFYQPEADPFPTSNDPAIRLIIDEKDPRFTSDGLKLQPVTGAIKNDVTVIGNDEPTTFVREHFISDGYQPNFALAFEPYGAVESSLLKDDFTSDTIDSQVWTESDLPSDYIRAFQGSLNIVGGPGLSNGVGQVFLRSRRLLELSGIIRTRDGELQFPPGAAAGQGVIGGMYTTADATMAESSLFSAWRIYLDNTYGAPKLFPWGPTGQESAYGVTLNLNHHYVLRRTFEVDRPFRALTTYQTSANSYVQSFSTQSANATCWISWSIDEINADDPNNVITTSTTLLRKQFTNIADYVVYSPVVSYNLHAILNFVEIFKPNQVTVLVDGLPVTVGNALDGGRCAITSDSGVARLAWYATPLPSQAQRSAQNITAMDVVTIPQQGSTVEVQYWRKDKSIARLKNPTSIAYERKKFRDDGIRQEVIHPGDVKPTPNTSEECQTLAQAILADQSMPRYEGDYTFETCENGITNLMFWPRPGDLVPVSVTLPDTTIVSQSLPITRVEASLVGLGAYQFTLAFGAINREQEVLRQLVLKRESSLQDPSIVDIEAVSDVDEATLTPPLDPSVTITAVTTSQVSLALTTPDTIVGYEVRGDDTGWGQPNYIDRFTTSTRTLNRSQRDQSFYIRPYNAAGIYSRRSAFVRVQHPLSNTITISSVDGTISPDLIEFVVKLPNNPDLAGVIVRQNNSSGSVVYQGDGVITKAQATGINVIAGTGSLTVRVPNTSVVRSYTIWVAPYDLIGNVGTGTTFTIDKPAPVVSNLTTEPSVPTVWTFTPPGTENWTEVTYFGCNGEILNNWREEGGVGQISVPDKGLARTIDITAQDAWTKARPDLYPPQSLVSSRSGDCGLPATPTISVVPNFNTSAGNFAFTLKWDFGSSPNMSSGDDIEIQYDVSSNFDNRPKIYHPAVSPAGTLAFNEPESGLYIRLRGKNANGYGNWSNIWSMTTGSPLDPLGNSSAWDYNNPTLGQFLRLGSGSGYSIGNANDGTGRSLNGLDLLGYVNLALRYGLGQLDAGGIARILINASNAVRDLVNGVSVESGAGRALNGLDGNGFLGSRILSSVLGYNPGGGLYPIFLANYNSLDNVTDGGTFGRPTYNQLSGSNRALAGLNSAGSIIFGLQSGAWGFIYIDDMGDWLYRSNIILQGGKYRVKTDMVDGYSIRAGVVYGANLSPDYVAAAGAPSSGPGFDRQLD